MFDFSEICPQLELFSSKQKLVERKYENLLREISLIELTSPLTYGTKWCLLRWWGGDSEMKEKVFYMWKYIFWLMWRKEKLSGVWRRRRLWRREKKVKIFSLQCSKHPSSFQLGFIHRKSDFLLSPLLNIKKTLLDSFTQHSIPFCTCGLFHRRIFGLSINVCFRLVRTCFNLF